MQAFRRLPPRSRRQPCALTIGNFDGVHLGHQALLARLNTRARERALVSCVLTFEPHPREYFARLGRGSAPPRISILRDKLDTLADCGVDRVNIAHFNASLASLAAEQFIEQILLDGLHTRYLLVGDDFRFGAQRRGDWAMLNEYAKRRGFELERLDSVVNASGRISSSLVRQALGAGDLEHAQELLGRPYSISGHVIHGRELGRTLGFPTLNLKLPRVEPALKGILAVRVHGIEPDRALPGVASLGTRPAVESDGRALLEVHLFDFNQDLYGRRIKVEFVEKLRDEAYFDSLEALRDQIDRDARAARESLAARVR